MSLSRQSGHYRAIAVFGLVACLSVVLACATNCSANETSDIDQLVLQAENLGNAGKWAEAEVALRNALTTCISKFGSFHLATAGLNRRLASFLIPQGRQVEAERCLQKALVITSGYAPAAALDGEFRGVSVFTSEALQNPDKLPGSFELADVLEGYASLYYSMGRFADAERMLKTATRIYEDGGASRASTVLYLNGDSQEAFLRAMLQLSRTQARQSKVVEAEQTLTKTIATVKGRKGSSSPQHVQALRALGQFYRGQGRNSEAETTENEAAALEQTN